MRELNIWVDAIDNNLEIKISDGGRRNKKFIAVQKDNCSLFHLSEENARQLCDYLNEFLGEMEIKEPPKQMLRESQEPPMKISKEAKESLWDISRFATRKILNIHKTEIDSLNNRIKELEDSLSKTDEIAVETSDAYEQRIKDLEEFVQLERDFYTEQLVGHDKDIANTIEKVKKLENNIVSQDKISTELQEQICRYREQIEELENKFDALGKLFMLKFTL